MRDGGKSPQGDAEFSMVLELDGDPAEPMPLVVRPLRSHEDYVQCEALERETWGQDFSECVPGSILMVSQKVGGVAAGAFDSAGRMVGMVYGLTGVRDGELVHWSHMLAVSEDLRGRSLGKELKLYQRRVVSERGVQRMLWTYDPLVARNAFINIERLGALPVEYLRDLYGPDTASELHSGLGTDRFVVEWDLDREEGAVERVALDFEGTPVVNTDADGGLRDPEFELPNEDLLRVEIPFDIQRVKASGADEGARWRASTRHAFETCLAAGYQVVGFERGEDSAPCRYQLSRPEGI